MAKQNKSPKFYVVWKGRKPGIYDTWAACEAQVKGFVNAQFKAFDSKAGAEEAFRGKFDDYKGKPTQNVVQDYLLLPDPPILPSLAVDAACSGNPGDLEFQGVDTQTRQVIFKRGPFPEGSNNIGEFLALVLALIHCQQHNLNVPIYSDSITAIAWVRDKRCKTELPQTPRNAPVFEMIQKAERWLQENTYPNPILKWRTEDWGESPADYGRKA